MKTPHRTPEEIQAEIDKIHADERTRQDRCQYVDGDEPHLGLSAWAVSRRLDALALEKDLAANGYTAEFPALARMGTAPPVPVAATLFRNPWGKMSWAIQDRAFPRYVTDGPRALAKHGLCRIMVRRPAKVELVGGGTGLSGCAGVYAAIVPDDG